MAIKSIALIIETLIALIIETFSHFLIHIFIMYAFMPLLV